MKAAERFLSNRTTILGTHDIVILAGKDQERRDRGLMGPADTGAAKLPSHTWGNRRKDCISGRRQEKIRDSFVCPAFRCSKMGKFVFSRGVIGAKAYYPLSLQSL